MTKKQRANPGGSFRLRGDVLLSHSRRAKNFHRASTLSNTPYPTAHKYLTAPRLPSISLSILADLAFIGFGITPEELAEMKFGDVFEFVKPEGWDRE